VAINRMVDRLFGNPEKDDNSNENENGNEDGNVGEGGGANPALRTFSTGLCSVIAILVFILFNL